MEKEKTFNFQGVVQPGYPSSLCVVFTKAGKTLTDLRSAELPRFLVPAKDRPSVVGRKVCGTVEVLDKSIYNLQTKTAGDYQYGVVRTLELLK